jgi:7-cyano-7-deazaguanine synthase
MHQEEKTNVIVLLSGGLDSSTVLAEAAMGGRTCHALTFRYGQRHLQEIKAARAIAKRFDVCEHKILDIDLRAFGASALTDDIEVPKDIEIDSDGIPVTYVPARNTIFLSFALAYAEVRGAREIWIGVNAIDYSGYPDCRPEYIAAFETMANLATRDGVEGNTLKIVTPLSELGKGDIVRRAIELGVPLESTHSCYDPREDGSPCQACDACRLRSMGFSEAGQKDPLLRGEHSMHESADR